MRGRGSGLRPLLMTGPPVSPAVRRSSISRSLDGFVEGRAPSTVPTEPGRNVRGRSRDGGVKRGSLVPWSWTPRDLSCRGGGRQCRVRREVRSAHRECAGDWGSRLTDGARSCRPVRGCGCEGSRLGSYVRPRWGGRFRLHEGVRRGLCRWGVRVVGWRGERCADRFIRRRDSTRSLALGTFGRCRDGAAERRGGELLGRAARRGGLLGRDA